MINRILAFTAATMAFCGAAIASPIPALSDGDTAIFGMTSNGFGGYDLILEGSVTVLALTDSQLTLEVTLDNVSTNDDGSAISDADAKNVRLSVWGFAITPDVTSVAFSDSADDGMVGAALGDIPSQKAIEVCAFGKNCSSGANLGILANGTDTFQLIMAGNFAGIDSITLDLIGAKWQTNNGSFEFSCRDCGDGGTPTGGQVPEPRSSALALLGLALVGGSFLRRQRVQRS